MTVLTSTQINHLNHMNRSAHDVDLGTRFDTLLSASAAANASLVTLTTAIGASGSYTLVAADITASYVAITTGLSAIKGEIVQCTRSGSWLSNAINHVAGSVAGTIYVQKNTPASGSPLLAGDVLTWIAF